MDVPDERNKELLQVWSVQRHVLQFGLKFSEKMSDLQVLREEERLREGDIQDLVDQLTSWECDMISLVRSDGFLENAQKVSRKRERGTKLTHYLPRFNPITWTMRGRFGVR